MGQDDAEVLFWGLAGASDRGCGNGGFAARSGRAFRDQCEFVGQMAAALAGGRERGAKAAWRKCFSTGRGCGADIGAGCRAAGLTLEETLAELRKQRIRTSRSSLWRFLDRHDITLKKKPAGGGTGTGRRGARPATLDARTRHV